MSRTDQEVCDVRVGSTGVSVRQLRAGGLLGGAPWSLAALAAVLGLVTVLDSALGPEPATDERRGAPVARAAPAEPGAGRPAHDSEDVARRWTAEGLAAVELVRIPGTIGPGEQVVLHLVNRGEVPLRAGLPFTVQRFDDGGWREVVPVDGEEVRWAWPAVAVELAPGGTTAGQRWPADPWGPPEPGRYRVVKTAVPVGAAGDREGDAELRVTATFRVRE